MNNKKLLGKRIKELRKNKGWTQEKFAEMIDLETATLSGIESGRHFPSLPTLERVALQLGVEIKVLFDYSHIKTTEEIKKEIIENIDKLSAEKLHLIYGMMI